jgi:hypothetical protein
MNPSIKSLFRIAICLLLWTAAGAQTTPAFKKLDDKKCFKDIPFGTGYAELEKKLGLKKGKQRFTGDYEITNPKYLTTGIYIVGRGVAHFSLKNELESVELYMDMEEGVEFNEVVRSFQLQYGEFKELGDCMWWFGNQISFSVCYEDLKDEAKITYALKKK